jgi:hypothetical protein
MTRFARGKATYAAGREMANTRGWAFNWRLVVAKGVGHSSKGMLRAEEMSAALKATGQQESCWTTRQRRTLSARLAHFPFIARQSGPSIVAMSLDISGQP